MSRIRLLLPVFAGCLTLSAVPGYPEVITETFATDPQTQGWTIYGDATLFCWNATNQNLDVTWDSTRPNSYYHYRLGTVLTRHDDFSLAFDLCLQDVQVAGLFELAIGFLNFGNATHPDFSRGTGNTPNVVEFDYFGDGGWGATTTPAFISRALEFAPTQFTPYKIALPMNQLVHVAMEYTASNQTLVTVLTTNGVLFAHLLDVTLDDPGNSQFLADSDYRVDILSISSYTATNDPWGDSLLAHGTVDNIMVTVPPPPISGFSGGFTNQTWRAWFLSRSNWLYTLERTSDFQAWTSVSPAAPGNASELLLEDATPPAGAAFYRVRAERP